MVSVILRSGCAAQKAYITGSEACKKAQIPMQQNLGHAFDTLGFTACDDLVRTDLFEPTLGLTVFAVATSDRSKNSRWPVFCNVLCN